MEDVTSPYAGGTTRKIDEDGAKGHIAIFFDAVEKRDGFPNMCALGGPTLAVRYRDMGYIVDLIPCYNMNQFVIAWNCKRDYNYDMVFILFHGNKNSIGWDRGIKYGRDDRELTQLNVTISVELYSCYGAAKDKSGLSTAQMFANKTNCPVNACTQKTFISPISGRCYCIGPFWTTVLPN